MAYNLFDLSGCEWHNIRTLDGARKKAYSLINGAPYRSTVFIYNGTRYLGTVLWYRTVEDPKRNIYKEHIVYMSGNVLLASATNLLTNLTVSSFICTLYMDPSL